MTTKPPHPTTPTAYLGGPSLRPQPLEQAARTVVVGGAVPRTVATLTVYADGRIRPSSEAVTLLGGHEAEGLCFYAPTPVRPGCIAQLWQVSAGDCHPFRTAGHGGHIQLRAAGDCPPPGRYLFTPVAGKPQQYALVPTG